MFVEHKEQGEVTEAPAKLDESSELLLKAAAIMERDGKSKDVWELDTDPHGTGKVCARVAIFRAAGSAQAPGADTADLRMQKYLRMNWRELQNWSDSSSQAEVISKLRAAALGL